MLTLLYVDIHVMAKPQNKKREATNPVQMQRSDSHAATKLSIAKRLRGDAEFVPFTDAQDLFWSAKCVI